MTWVWAVLVVLVLVLMFQPQDEDAADQLADERAAEAARRDAWERAGWL